MIALFGRRANVRAMRFPCACGLLAVILTALAAAVAAPTARADGDPASDVLLYQHAFFPYATPSTAAKAELPRARWPPPSAQASPCGWR